MLDSLGCHRLSAPRGTGVLSPFSILAVFELDWVPVFFSALSTLCSIYVCCRDRQLYVTYKGEGQTGFYSDYNHLTSNFLVANYDSSQGIDNDDGSA